MEEREAIPLIRSAALVIWASKIDLFHVDFGIKSLPEFSGEIHPETDCRIPWVIGVRPMRFGKKQAEENTQADTFQTGGRVPNGPGKESLKTLSTFLPKNLSLGKGEICKASKVKGRRCPDTPADWGKGYVSVRWAQESWGGRKHGQPNVQQRGDHPFRHDSPKGSSTTPYVQIKSTQTKQGEVRLRGGMGWLDLRAGYPNSNTPLQSSHSTSAHARGMHDAKVAYKGQRTRNET